MHYTLWRLSINPETETRKPGAVLCTSTHNSLNPPKPATMITCTLGAGNMLTLHVAHTRTAYLWLAKIFCRAEWEGNSIQLAKFSTD